MQQHLPKEMQRSFSTKIQNFLPHVMHLPLPKEMQHPLPNEMQHLRNATTSS